MKNVRVVLEFEMTEDLFNNEGKELFNLIDSGELAESFSVEGGVVAKVSYEVL